MIPPLEGNCDSPMSSSAPSYPSTPNDPLNLSPHFLADVPAQALTPYNISNIFPSVANEEESNHSEDAMINLRQVELPQPANHG